VPASAGKAPSLDESSHEKATTVGGRSPGDQGNAASASDSFQEQRASLMRLLGVTASSPSKSPLRKSSKKQSRRSHVGRALDYGEAEEDAPDDVSKLPSQPEVIDVEKEQARTPATKEPPTHTSLPPPTAEATFNPTKLRTAKRTSLSPWCLPVKTSFSLRELDSQLPAGSSCLKPLTKRRPKSPSASTASVSYRRR
jgi:hypothetical protein